MKTAEKLPEAQRNTLPFTTRFRFANSSAAASPGKQTELGAWPAIAKLINATTGWDFTYDDVELIGERAHTIKKAFNIREGWTEQDDHLPYRWQHEAFKEGASKDTFVTDDELKYLKKLYYEAKGWTEDGFIPKEKLIALGMEDIAEEIGV